MTGMETCVPSAQALWCMLNEGSVAGGALSPSCRPWDPGRGAREGGGGAVWRHRSRERGTGRRWCVLGAWAKQPCAAHAAAARCQIAGSSRDSWYRPWRSISGSAKLVAVRVPVLGDAPASAGCAGSETEGRHQFCLLFHRRRSSAGAEFRGVDQRLRANGALRRVRGDGNFPGRGLARGRTHLAAAFRHHGLVRFKTSRRRVSWSGALSARVEEKKTTYA